MRLGHKCRSCLLLLQAGGGSVGVHFSIVIILGIGFIFYLARATGLEFFPFLMYGDLTQGFYWASGVRLLAVLLFGWLGALGIVCGWVFCYWLGGERTLLDCVLIGVLSGGAAYAALRLWQRCFQVDDGFELLTVRLLLFLVAISACISSFVRLAYLSVTEPELPLAWVFSLGFVGDILGCLAVLYLFKLTLHLYRSYSLK